MFATHLRLPILLNGSTRQHLYLDARYPNVVYELLATRHHVRQEISGYDAVWCAGNVDRRSFLSIRCCSSITSYRALQEHAPTLSPHVLHIGTQPSWRGPLKHTVGVAEMEYRPRCTMHPHDHQRWPEDRGSLQKSPQEQNRVTYSERRAVATKSASEPPLLRNPL